MSFLNLGLSKFLLLSVQKEGYQHPTPIQIKSLPLILKGDDLMAEAQTGSGKTAGFALPILQILSESSLQNDGVIKALVLVPTRELALQVGRSFKVYGQFLPKKLKILTLIGGEDIELQKKGLQNLPDIVVATPGRLLEMIEKKLILLITLKFLVLDEADKLLDLGFSQDLQLIFKEIPHKVQTLLFSATIPEKLRKLTTSFLHNPHHIKIAEEIPSVENIHQRVIEVNKDNKGPLLRHLIKSEQWNDVLIFVSTKRAAQNLATKLNKVGILVKAFHGDLLQSERMQVLKEFQLKKIHVLVATDLAARGIDFYKLSYVVNYDLPRSPNDYIHRIGRTGRAGEKGIAITLIGHEDQKHFALIEKRAKIHLPREHIEGFALTGTIPIVEFKKAPLKGKRKSKKDRAREALAKAGNIHERNQDI